MISLLLHESEAKDIKVIQMYLGYNWFITQKTLPINAFFVNSKQWLQVMFTYHESFFWY